MCTIRINFTLAQEQISSVPVPFVHTAEVAGEKTVSKTSLDCGFSHLGRRPQKKSIRISGKWIFAASRAPNFPPKKEIGRKAEKFCKTWLGCGLKQRAKLFFKKWGETLSCAHFSWYSSFEIPVYVGQSNSTLRSNSQERIPKSPVKNTVVPFP